MSSLPPLQWGLRAGAVSLAMLAPTLMPASAADETAQFAAGKALFSQGAVPSCAICHTLRDAGSEGAVGPILDELKPDVEQVSKVLRNGLGQMPAYRATLTDADIAALAVYVSRASGGTR